MLYIGYRGTTFRERYGEVGVLRSRLTRGVITLLLTATLTEELKKDLLNILAMEEPVVVSTSLDL
jgi:superfamily II DNA helicase RecQ